NEAISEFFGFTMLSHRWGGSEPLLRDTEGKRIYGLRGTDGVAKLQNFCILALRRGFRWAWSDSCCIDKDSSAELQEAIGSMFSWYHRSSLTIVYLADVTGTGSLAHSDWFKRGWTLQELLASNTVLFYAKDWSPYVNSSATNHKTDPTLLKELCKATRISEQHLRNFNPGMEDSRSRLCWASHRRTTRPEDTAYSLFGIFKVQLPVLYGETAEDALGRLLAEIISRSGDLAVLDW
ncbi:heterokaryon incompatibility protein-domain-containing protein, partial [Pisolithus albus]